MTLVHRAGLGRNLTADEGDGNIDDLDGRITVLEDNPPTAVSIDDIELLGDQLTITMTDYTTFTVTLPASYWRSRGYFANATTYLINDVFVAKGTLWVVLFNHVSSAPFDPGANDGMGHDYYAIALPNFGFPTTVNNASTTIVVTSAMENQYVRCTATSPVTVTLSEANLLLMSDDFEFQIRQHTDLGTLTFNIEGTITTNTRFDRQLNTAISGAVVLIKRVGTLELDFIGDLAASDS